MSCKRSDFFSLCLTSFHIFLLFYIIKVLKFDGVIINLYKLLSRKDSTYTDFFLFVFLNCKPERKSKIHINEIVPLFK